MVAIYRLSKNAVVFILFLSHTEAMNAFFKGVGNIFSLCQYIWLAVEILLNTKLTIPGHISTFLFRFCFYSNHLNVILISMNRCYALFYPLAYNYVWTKK
uniref:7TM GPCR serpentine receptor class x (Srx) domain-containing protein n=1 Tax=Ditylenchus dipsaci TaxID=166011 RepID=A0A915DFE4_9BILA